MKPVGENMASVIENQGFEKSLDFLCSTLDLSPDIRAKIECIVDHSPALMALEPKDDFVAIRDYLNELGIDYDANSGEMEDLALYNKCNCGSLSAIVYLILLRRNRKPSIELVTDPHDYIWKQEQIFLKDEIEMPYNDLVKARLVPESEQEIDALFRFLSLSHPIINESGVRFETTALDAEDDSDVVVSYEAGLIKSITFETLCAHMLVDKAVIERDMSKREFLMRKSLEIDPRCSEAWFGLWDMGIREGEIISNFLESADDTARHNFYKYRVLGDIKYLDRALEQYPAYMAAFIEKNVILEQDIENARINSVIASNCVSNSGVYTLSWMYHNPQIRDRLNEIWGKDLTID